MTTMDRVVYQVDTLMPDLPVPVGPSVERVIEVTGCRGCPFAHWHYGLRCGIGSPEFDELNEPEIPPPECPLRSAIYTVRLKR